MLAVVVSLKLKPGVERDFEDSFTLFSRAVRENEPANHLFQLCRRPGAPGEYKVLEIYEDQAGLEAHGASAHAREHAAALAAMFAEPPAIEILDVVIGAVPS